MSLRAGLLYPLVARRAPGGHRATGSQNKALEQLRMGIVRGFFELLAETKRCPKCKAYSPEKRRPVIAFSIFGGGEPWEKLGYCNELGLFIYRCPKCGALIRDDTWRVLSPEHEERYKDSLKQKV